MAFIHIHYSVQITAIVKLNKYKLTLSKFTSAYLSNWFQLNIDIKKIFKKKPKAVEATRENIHIVP